MEGVGSYSVDELEDPDADFVVVIPLGVLVGDRSPSSGRLVYRVVCFEDCVDVSWGEGDTLMKIFF